MLCYAYRHRLQGYRSPPTAIRELHSQTPEVRQKAADAGDALSGGQRPRDGVAAGSVQRTGLKGVTAVWRHPRRWQRIDEAEGTEADGLCVAKSLCCWPYRMSLCNTQHMQVILQSLKPTDCS